MKKHNKNILAEQWRKKFKKHGSLITAEAIKEMREQTNNITKHELSDWQREENNKIIKRFSLELAQKDYEEKLTKQLEKEKNGRRLF